MWYFVGFYFFIFFMNVKSLNLPAGGKRLDG